ncbi:MULTISPECIES: molybdopterin oxidoreductase family protein [unclassified Methylibium]|uniref:molybdopterin oxidoreductase family protein n=1 Tax=unclassified Methylibium TaxID=2633235 RepID=UPI0003F457BE|nr:MULTISPECIES: molybdopterin oxidoreductase family protein [unclassified Methylibium]EWS54859.1 putative dimethyl sulfoxide reductase chain YnfE precursor [Methylibium sp. T29]EWS59829.1 putative dimethyl sulfoxide reductase chain YnfE precursor [Methylibium sp. T29-B]
MFKFLSSDPIHDPLAPPLPAAPTEVKCTTCYMCACRCGIRVHLRQGENGPEVRYIDGNPAHPINQGVICAKGSSGIMKQVSPARLTQPLLRKKGSDRGAGEFEPISWDLAFEMLTERLQKIRSTDPKKFALFTGRDQMQALTGLFARQFGTPNYAAHGGFCSVNMAAGMIYTIGGSFWEFGGPDLDHARLFVMIGTAEDHHSNPMKIALSKFKRAGGRFISINPVRTGYSAIADEWIPIKPGTDGALFMALLHELIASDLIDRPFLQRYTNAPQLVVLEDGEREGLFAFDPAAGPPGDGRNPHNKLVWDLASGSVKAAYPEGIAEGCEPALEGHYRLADGTRVAPSFELLRERVATCTPEWASQITGIPAERIRKLARELGETALQQAFELPIPWTDAWGKQHPTTSARPVAFHAMRGLAAHSNGFQTVRALAVLMSVLGTIDAPGGFRHKAPYPRHIVPNYRAFNSPEMIKPNTPLNAAPLGFPASPDELAINPDGSPIRIDHAFSWEHPLSAHGLMHNVITNATKGDPYRIDTLLIFMANMAWNSTMNTMAVREMLNAKADDGEFKIPFLVVCDAFQSEMVAFADLVLPDTTYLERHDVMSMLDRPISEFDGPVDSVRVPVLPPTGQCKPFQEVLIELASRLKFPAFTTAEGGRKFTGYPDFVVKFEPQPGIGFLMGWRGEHGDKHLRGAPNPKQWEMYEKNNCVFQYHLPKDMQYMRNWNRGYLDFAKEHGWRQRNDPVQLALYSDTLQSFRLAAQGKTPGRQPPEHLRERIATYFDPLPFWYPPLEYAATDEAAYPLNAITQRPMAMYHSWDSQNAWLRQIHSHNYLQVNPLTAQAAGIADGGWCWVESQWGKLRCMLRYSEAVEPGTVWTWNAIGKADGAWQLAPGADESRKGFLLNHLISEELPLRGPGGAAGTISNSDPITGQAGWYDVRVRIRPAAPEEPAETFPQVKATPAPPGVRGTTSRVLTYFAGRKTS